MNPEAQSLIEKLKLSGHPEGGYYRETHLEVADREKLTHPQGGKLSENKRGPEKASSCR